MPPATHKVQLLRNYSHRASGEKPEVKRGASGGQKTLDAVQAVHGAENFVFPMGVIRDKTIWGVGVILKSSKGTDRWHGTHPLDCALLLQV
mmetsp:Transcript_28372/g.55162  ORF Transcript_28372/g.55162 Transcript_28372/m.55162 type:complete len:91 (-) Transcript_28372:50-322(-)